MQKNGTGSPQVNRAYKDSLFRMIFREKENLLSLYNAISGTNYDNPDELSVVTLENALYMNMKNDLAFILDCSINLYEHQATRNPNMPLRDLFYISKEYQTLVSMKTLYAGQLVKIPNPNFLVFYNGTEALDERVTLKLSDAFETATEHPNLELIVTILNINEGYNRELLDACRVLREYMVYVNRVRLYAETMALGKAIERAVDECIKEGILEAFLRKNRAEAIEVSIFEYDEVREQKLIRESEFAAGKAEGKIEGLLLAKRIYQLEKEGYMMSEISRLTGVSEAEVKTFLE